MDSTSSKTTFYLVRHGETEWNVKKILQGHKNSRLTKKGIDQAKQLASVLKDIHFDVIFSSDLRRARRTAEILMQERSMKMKSSKFFREKTFGIYDGYPIDAYRTETQQALDTYEQMNEQEQWDFKCHSTMESEREVVNRFITRLQSIAKNHPAKTVLVVTHGGCLRFFLSYIGFASREALSFGSVGNAAYIKLTSDGKKFTVVETTGVTLQEN